MGNNPSRSTRPWPHRWRRSARSTTPAAAGPTPEDSAAFPAVPSFDWAFASNTVLGGVAPGFRDARFMDRLIPYAPHDQLCSGTRWCSQRWLDRGVGSRGFRARKQSHISVMGMTTGGRCTGGTFVVIPEEQLDAAAALAARSLATDTGAESGLYEWSTAIVRETGRSRLAIWAVANDEALGVFAAELDVEWFLHFQVVNTWGAGATEADEPELLTVQNSSRVTVAELEGCVHLENEEVPARQLEVAEKYGNGLAQRGRKSAFISTSPRIPVSWSRPLEPDELGIDRDRGRWEH